MKTRFTLLLAAVSMIACGETSDEIRPSSRPLTFEAEFEPLTSESRLTTDDTGRGSWEADDDLSIFIVKESTITPWINTRFVTNATDYKQNIFHSVAPHPILEAGMNYDWYVMRPYNPDIHTPLGNGVISFADFQQDYPNPTRHLSAADVMTSVNLSQPSSMRPKVSLHHRGTLLRFRITNQYSGIITLLSVELQAPPRINLSGDFTLNFRSGEFIPMAAHTSNTARLEVVNALPLTPNESYSVYFITPPFDLRIGEDFRVKVSTNRGSKIFKCPVPRQIFFRAGMLNHQDLVFSN